MARLHNTNNVNNARKLRRNMTEEERHLWYDYLRNCPIRFYRQKPIGNYIVDFYCPILKLVIELDGSQHYLDKDVVHDKIRTDKLKQYNLSILRIPNNEITTNFTGVCEYIDNLIQTIPQSKS